MVKHDFRERAWVKAIAVVLFIACGVGACFSWIYCAIYWNDLFGAADYTSSPAYVQAMNNQYGRLMELCRYEESLRAGKTLSYLQEQDYQTCRSELSSDATNFRYIVRDNATGEILFSSMGETSMDNVSEVHLASRDWGEQWFYTEYDSGDGMYHYYDAYGDLIHISASPDDDFLTPTDLAIEFGVDKNLPVSDGFSQARAVYVRGDVRFLYAAASFTAGLLILAVFLLCCAGHRRDCDGFVLNWQDRIPYDLYLALSLTALILCACVVVSELDVLYDSYFQLPSSHFPQFLLCVLLTAVFFALASALLMTTASRLKARVILRNTLIWRLLRLLGRGIRRIARGLRSWGGAVFGNWSLTRRAVLGFLLYLLGTVLTALTVILIPFYQGAVLFLLCRWIRQWNAVRAGTRAIVGGQPDTVIDTAGMKFFPDLREHAEQLNDLGGAINSAVEERMKSERMKAELITNVSHDLKTPLTSIINYVDLLKKEDIQNETAREYIDVLDRKSQRLKKLTEDLVEASKASTGALAVNRERLGVAQLIHQALGEYAERFSAASLTPVVSLPEDEVFVSADGRHLWRVLDNLMGNCVKYAMPGTRVYLDAAAWDGHVVISIKNISALPLNIPSEQLMERFVRGDESRTTEGSGLGLSIARSLTELQGGTFRLEVDGDLFKAVLSFPQIP